MELTEFEVLDSTSLEVQRCLSAKKLPFAVSAKIQNAGKGRRGRSWSSPEGNVYVSLALGGATDPEERGLVPLKVACLIADWLQKTMGLRVTVKWPNDICFGTRKLAGILCESTWSGREWGPLVIGIGINVHKPPADTPYPSVGLASLRSEIPSCGILIRSLLEFWGQYWDVLSVEKVMELCAYYAPGPGHYWSEEHTGQIFVTDKVENDGSLRVSHLNGNRRVSLNSATHGFTWIYQRCEAAPVMVLLEEGGTSVLGCFRDRAEAEPGIYTCEISKPDFRMLNPPPGEWPVFCGLDNPEDFTAVKESLGACGLKAWSLRKRPVLLRMPEQDLPRWYVFAVMEGWLSLQQRGENKKNSSALALVEFLPGKESAGLTLLHSDGCVRLLQLALSPEGEDFPGGLSVFSLPGPGCEGFFKNSVTRFRGPECFGFFHSGWLRLSLTGDDSSSISGSFSPESDSSLAMRGLASVALGGLI